MRILIVALFLTSLTAVASAQDANKVAAEAAFQKGKELEGAGKTAEACDQFARSQELDPQLGTLYNLARCHQKLGKLASAWQEFSELAAKDSNKKRKADAAKQVKALAPRLTYMVLKVASKVDGLVVTRDGVDVTQLVELDTPVDPATYTFEAKAPGFLPWSAQVDLTKEGARVAIEVPTLTPEPVKDPGDGDGDGTGDGDGDGDGTGDGNGDGTGDGNGIGGGDTPPPPPSNRGKGRRLLGLVTGGVGVVATGAGIVFGLKAQGLVGDAEDACGGGLNPCSGDVIQAQFDIDDARSAAGISTVATISGLVLIGVGTFLYISAPDGDSGERAATITPVLGHDQAGVAFSGAF